MTWLNRHRGDRQGADNTTIQRIPPPPRHHLEEKVSSEPQGAHLPSSNPLQCTTFSGTTREIARHYHAEINAHSLFKEPLAPVAQTLSGATLYGPRDKILTDVPPGRPLKIAFLTSIRDVGLEEHVGTYSEHGNPDSYVKGTIETALEAVKDDRLGDFAEIVAIITDDVSADLKRCDYVADPRHNGEWIFPREMRNKNGELATSITVNVPSTFRSLPLKDVEGRKAQKFEFESKIFKILREAGADILLSDHFLARIDYLIRPDHFRMLGRVLNTHPGIIRPDHPYTCLGKLPYDQMRLHAQGLRLMGDKSLAHVPPCDIAGATFHLITAGIDRGPVLCDAELTRISPTDSDVTVARKLYQTSKYHAFIEGVRHYASNIFPMFMES